MVAAVALGAAFTLAACGDSGESGANGESAQQQARATVERFYAALKGGDAEGVCALLAEEGREEIVESLGEGKAGDTCAEAFERFMRNARRTGNLSPKLAVRIQGIEVTGDKAIATVAVGGNPLTELPLAYSDGRWRVASAAPAD